MRLVECGAVAVRSVRQRCQGLVPQPSGCCGGSRERMRAREQGNASHVGSGVPHCSAVRRGTRPWTTGRLGPCEPRRACPTQPGRR